MKDTDNTLMQDIENIINETGYNKETDLKNDPFIEILIDRRDSYNGKLINKKTSIATNMLNNGLDSTSMDENYVVISDKYDIYENSILEREKNYGITR